MTTTMMNVEFNATSTLETSTVMLMLNDTKSGHEQLVEKIIEKMNVTNLIKAQGEREGRYLQGNVTSRGQNLFAWDPYRINTVAYIGLALLCVILLGIVSGFYAR